jgi:hypothetical protein
MSAPLAAECCAASYHGWPSRNARHRRPHGAPDAEDLAARERRQQSVRYDSTVLQEVFERPKGELSIVGRQADRPIADLFGK